MDNCSVQAVFPGLETIFTYLCIDSSSEECISTSCVMRDSGLWRKVSQIGH